MYMGNFKLIFIKKAVKLCILTLLLLTSIIIFSATSIFRNKSEIWFANPDQDGTLLIESIRINSGKRPCYLDHPSHGTFIIYSNTLQFLDLVGLISVSNFDQLQQSDDPLTLLPELFYKSRLISISLCVLCGLIFGGIFWVLTRQYGFFVLGVFLLLFSGGIFTHSLIIRSELASVLFILLSILVIAIEHMYNTNNVVLSNLCRFISGLFLGLAVLSKVHVSPAVVFIIICSLFSILHKNKMPRSQSSQITKLYRMALYAFLLYEIYNAIRFSYPMLFMLFLSVIIAGEIIARQPKLQNNTTLAAITKTRFLLIGFLLAFHVSFYCLNFNRDTDNRGRYWKVMTYKKVFDPFETTQTFSSRAKDGLPAVYSDFKKFCNYYMTTSYHFILLIALVILVISLSRRFPEPLAITALLFGFIMCLISSLRYYMFFYLIYSDVFFIGAIMVLVVQYDRINQNRSFPWKHLRYLVYPLICLAVCAAGVKQYHYVSGQYVNICSLKDRADIVYKFVFCAEEYEALMLSQYKSVENITKRICNDPYLNGSNRGIDLRQKPNAQKYYSQYFTSPE